MSRVLEFPTKPVRDWESLEPEISGLLHRTPADAAEQQAILSRLHAFFELCNRSYSARVKLPLPASCTPTEGEALRRALDAALAEYRVWLQDFVNDLVLERVEMEIARCFDPH